MNAREFLRRTVGTEGTYCLFVLKRDANGDVEKKIQRFFDDLEDLLEQAERFDERGFDTYFALATFKDGTTNRYASHALQMRALFLDLDCGEDKANPPDGGRPKGYTDQVTALRELKSFCRGNALPMPLIINSGRGLHVYWCLETPVSVEEWKPVAEALKAACTTRNLLADPAVTTDAARILRVPGTRNYKSDPPAMVEVWDGASIPDPVTLGQMTKLLGADAPKLRPAANSSVLQRMSAVQEKLSKNLTSSFKRIVERTIDGDGCEQIGEMLRRPASVDEPTWRAGLSVAAHCADADKAIHAISKGHPEYDPEETEEKAARIKGPYTCAKFDEFRPGICEGCPHWGVVKSPIVLGKELAAAPEEPVTVEVLDQGTGVVKEYDIPTLPKPYKRGSNGGIYKVVQTEDGTDHELVYIHDLYVVRRAYDKDEQVESVLLRLHLPRDGVREFAVELSTMQSPQEFAKALAAQGVTARSPGQWKQIGGYLVDWIEELQMTTEAATAHRQFGWTDGMESFLLGDREYMPGAVRNNAPTPATQQYMSAFRPKGSLEQWKELINVYNQPGLEVYQLVICASFGSPLMEFLPQNGLTIHLNSATGYGKTTLQMAALSVWGAPELLALADKDTNNSKFLRLEVMKNLPVVFDEMTNTDPAQLSDLLYAVTQGRQRGRMAGGANIERVRGNPWALIAISSGNAGFYDKLDVHKTDNAAEKARVFEIRMAKHIAAGPKADMNVFERKIKRECYGFAGDVFMNYVVNNQDTVYELLMEVQARLDNAAGLGQQERYVSAGLACTITAGIIAEQLGLIFFDMKALFDKVVELADVRLRDLTDASLNAKDILSAYLAENIDRTLRIDSTQRKGAGPNELIVPDALAKGQLAVRWEPDVGKAYLMPAPLRSWCAKRQISYEGFLADLPEFYTVERGVKVRMERGTAMEPINARVTVVHMEAEKDAVVDEADEAES